MTTLSVNINKVAVLRNSRGNSEPDPVAATRVAIESGCHGITVHPRPDQRHIRVNDVMRVAALIGTLQVAGTEDAPLDPCAQMKPAKPDIEYNIEGNPFAAPRNDYPGLIELVRAVRPAQATLVPDDDGQLTSDHGFDLERDAGRLAPLVRELKSIGVRVSLFVDAGAQGIERVADIGAERIEIYTGPYAKAFAHGDCARELDACVRSAELAHACGLGVNAGHDLDQNNLGALKAAIPFLAEVSIGHALFADAIYAGLASTVRNYLAILAID